MLGTGGTSSKSDALFDGGKPCKKVAYVSQYSLHVSHSQNTILQCIHTVHKTSYKQKL